MTDVPPPPHRWRSAAELLTIGLHRSRVVLMNEAHSGLARCIRTRRLGRRLLPAAHDAGVRWLAMEALVPQFAADANATGTVPAAAGGYLAQSELRDLISAALELGWQLVAYEADFTLRPPELEHLSIDETNWREEQQARNLDTALAKIPGSERVLVWCGNHHLAKHANGEWTPMAVRFAERTGLEPFALDQVSTVTFGNAPPVEVQWVDAYAHELEARDGAAGFLAEEAPEGWPPAGIADAFVLALDNELE